MTDLKVAVIGAGYMAGEHIPAFADVPGVIVAGIFSRTRSKAEALAARFGIPAVCDSVDELYKKTKADLVVVTVVELSMNGVAKACFQYPWTVLLEKPAGYTLADAEDIARAAREKGSRVFVALNRRFNSSTRTVLDDLADREGQRYIRVGDQQDQAAALAAGQPPAVVENWMFANSIHTIDYLRLFGRGKVTRVEPVLPWDPKNPGTVLSRVDFDSGDVGLYEGIWNGPGPWSVCINVPGKRWELRPLEQAAFQNKGERRLQPVDPHPWDGQFKPGLRLQAEAAVAAARGERSDAASIDDALETMRLVQAIFRK